MSAISTSALRLRPDAWTPPRPTAPQPRPAAAPVWTEVADDFWVASGADGFAGTVELDGGHFAALDGTGIEIGRYESLADAQAAVLDPDTRGYQRRLSQRETERRLAIATAIVGGVSCLGSGALIVTGVLL